MKSLMIGYLIFIIVIALVIAGLISWLRIKLQKRAIFLILIIIASPVIIGYLILSYFAPIPETVVPDLVGTTEIQAKSRLESAGLSTYVEKRYEGFDIVSFQRPEAGRVVKEGRTVTIIVGSPKTVNYLTPPASQETMTITPESMPIITKEGENTE